MAILAFLMLKSDFSFMLEVYLQQQGYGAAYQGVDCLVKVVGHKRDVPVLPTQPQDFSRDPEEAFIFGRTLRQLKDIESHQSDRQNNNVLESKVWQGFLS